MKDMNRILHSRLCATLAAPVVSLRAQDVFPAKLGDRVQWSPSARSSAYTVAQWSGRTAPHFCATR
jgi:hypothetical protein